MPDPYDDVKYTAVTMLLFAASALALYGMWRYL